MADDFDDDDEDEVEAPSRRGRREDPDARSAELIGREEIKKACLEIYRDVESGFVDQYDRTNSQLDYWDIYNCELGPKQFYSGNSKIFVPIVSDAVDARVTRFTNQMFPQSGRHIEVIASEDTPMALTSLLEHYIRRAKLRTSIAPVLCRNGDLEGQYTLYVSWAREERHVSMRVQRGPTIDAPVDDGTQPGDPDELDPIEGVEPVTDIISETITRAHPQVEVISDADLLVLPVTATSINSAVENGGSVSIIRRWSKSKIRQLIRRGEIDKAKGQDLLRSMAQKLQQPGPDLRRRQLAAAGIHVADGQCTAHVVETWAKIKIKDEYRICRIYFGGEDNVLSCKRNPYWCDQVPVLSAPVTRVEGSFKGVSKIKKVETLQYGANDAVNQGMDSAAYALLPIIMTDPDKNPRVGSMVLNVAAIWQTSPNDTQFAKFPDLWKDAFMLVNSTKDQIFQTLGVNPAMMPQQVTAPNKKPNQAQIANEQMVDILTTADAVTNIEGEILSPLLQWFVYLDHQFREEEMAVPSYGQMGVELEMTVIQPIQMDRRFEFRWFGVEAARNAQQLQMQMAGLNTLRGIPPQLYPGHRLDVAPIITQFVENVYGTRLGPRVFKSIKDELSINPEFENTMLEAGLPLEPHPMDDDQAHIQAHMAAFNDTGDVTGSIRTHIIKHTMALQQKAQAQMAQMAQARQGTPGSPGGAGPGLAGTPRPGALSAGPRPNGQLPPGAIHADELDNTAPRVRN